LNAAHRLTIRVNLANGVGGPAGNGVGRALSAAAPIYGIILA
jgi:hypothetical protein